MGPEVPAAQESGRQAVHGSYRQILKTSSIMGGSQGINLVLGMVRVKFTAILLGAVGVGLYGNYIAIMGVAATLAGLGIQSSAVRDVVQALGQGDSELFGRTVLSMRRVCLATGLLGGLMIISLSPQLSQWTFGSEAYALQIALLGPAILLGNIVSGQTALLQGAQRIGDLARVNIIGSFVGTPISIGLYIWLGMDGIIPTLLLLGGVQLGVSWYFARRVTVPEVGMSWWESIQHAGGMVRLGLAFMWSGLLAAGSAYMTRVIITQEISLEAVGIFSAAFALSGMFVNFIFSAMGSDYYPRLTAVSSDPSAMNRLINEQTEVGILLSVPGVLATLSFSPWIVQIFYTRDFLPATDLLQWFIFGCAVRILSWPLGYVILALGKGYWFFMTCTFIELSHLVMIWFWLKKLGIVGSAFAYFLMCLLHLFVMYSLSRHWLGFRWSASNKRLVCMALPIISLVFFSVNALPFKYAIEIGLFISLISAVFCLRALARRLGKDQRLIRLASYIPGMAFVCGLR